jgi:hypothetical protein
MPRFRSGWAPLALALAGAACGPNTPLRVGPAPAALATIPWGPGEVVDYCGDSLVAGGVSGAGGVSVAWPTPFEADVDATLGAAGKPRATAVHGYTGTQMSAWAATYRDVLGHAGTIAFVAWGVNDAIARVAPAATRASLEAGVRAAWAVEPTKRFVIIGPMNAGERWPEGAGDVDASIEATSAAMKAGADALAASGTITWVDPRAWWFPAIEAANPTDTEGALALTVDGLHLNARGASGAADFIWSLRDPS